LQLFASEKLATSRSLPQIFLAVELVRVFLAQVFKGCWSIEAAICRLKDFRRVATSYGKLAANFASAASIAAAVAFWC
jgi:transposase